MRGAGSSARLPSVLPGRAFATSFVSCLPTKFTGAGLSSMGTHARVAGEELLRGDVCASVFKVSGSDKFVIVRNRALGVLDKLSKKEQPREQGSCVTKGGNSAPALERCTGRGVGTGVAATRSASRCPPKVHVFTCPEAPRITYFCEPTNAAQMSHAGVTYYSESTDSTSELTVTTWDSFRK